MARLFTEFLPFFLVVIWGGLGLALGLESKEKRTWAETLLHSIPLGMGAWAIILQACWKAGFNISAAAWPALAFFSLINLAWLLRYRRARPPKAGSTRFDHWSPLLGLSLAMLTPCGVLLFSGNGYYGRAWGDQLNYSLLANFLNNVSGHAQAPGFLRPELQIVLDGGLLHDRIGQSLLQGLVMQAGGTDIFQAFYYVCLVSLVASYAALFLLARGVGAGRIPSAMMALLGMLAPCMHPIHLESFLSQAVGTPILIYSIVAAQRLLERFSPARFLALTVCVSFTLSAYFEYFPLLVGLLLVVGLADVWRMRRLRPALCGLALAGALGALHVLTAAENPFLLMKRAGVQPVGFEKFFPWAYSWEGFARPIVGDWVSVLALWQLKFIALLLLGGTAVSFVFLAREVWKHRNVAAAGTMALLSVPLAIYLIPQERSYQFYKTFQSFWPLVFVGGAVAYEYICRRLPRARIWMAGLITGMAVLFGSASGAMIFAERAGGSPRSGMNAYLRAYPRTVFTRLFTGRTERHLVLSMPSHPHFNDLLANGITALRCGSLFQMIQAKFVMIGDRPLAAPQNPDIPPDPSDPRVRTLWSAFANDLESCLILQVGVPWLRPSTEFFSVEREAGRLLLLKPGQDWCLANMVNSPFPAAFLETDHFVRVSSPDHYLRVDFESSIPRPEGLTLELAFGVDGGSSNPDWHVYSNTGYGVRLTGRSGKVTLTTGPLRQGVTEVFLAPIEPGLPDVREATGGTRVRVTSLIYGPKH